MENSLKICYAGFILKASSEPIVPEYGL
jgi:hypothetical protein